MSNEIKVVPNVTVVYQDSSTKSTPAPGCLEVLAMVVMFALTVVAIGVMN